MADIRCPMCGKLNPAEAETCRFCKARIKPLVAGSNAPTNSSEPVSKETPGEAAGKSRSTPARKNTSELESSLPGWLSDLRPDKDETTRDPRLDWPEEGGTSSQDELFPSDESVLPDWLSRIRKGDEAETPGQSAASEEPPFVAPEIPSEEPSSALSSDESADSGGFPDWLSRLGNNDAANQEETPAYEQPIIPEEEQLSSEEESLPPAEPGALPDWLSNMGSGKAEQEPEPAAQNPGQGSELPDWLATFNSRDNEEEAAPAQPEETEPEQAQDDRPDWLRRIHERQEEDRQATGSQAGSSEPDGSASPFSEEAASHEDLPDWLATLGSDSAEPLPEEPFQPAAPEQAPIPQAENLPDWLSTLSSLPSDQGTGSSVPALILDDQEISEQIPPSFLPKDESALQAEPAAEDENYLSALPEWISQVSSEQTQEEGAEGEGPGQEPEASLTPAQLPSWLEAMRPMEAVTPDAPLPDEASGDEEKAGPLAGLKGVLPAEPEFTHLTKPPAYSIKLQVTDGQQKNIELMEKLLATESEPKPLPAKAMISSQLVLRLLIAILLILSVLAPLWLSKNQSYKNQVPLTTDYQPEEVKDAANLVSSLPANAQVMVAFDYQPALSGEMEASSSAVLETLVSKNAYLTLVSTSPTGPILAGRLMTSLIQKVNSSYTRYANLGYLSGGAAGILGFAQNPPGAMPFSLTPVENGASGGTLDPWHEGPLQNIHSLADFSMVLVITDDPDVARSWIEQAQPVLQNKNIPLLMITSAQAEPLILPYYKSQYRQVSGLISGLPGAAIYEGLTSHPSLVRAYWDAFSAGVGVAAVLILIGGIVNFVMIMMSPKKQSDREGKQ